MNLHEALFLSEEAPDPGELRVCIHRGIEQACRPVGSGTIRLNQSQAALVLVHGGANGIITDTDLQTFVGILNRVIEGLQIKSTTPEKETLLRSALERHA